MASQFGLVEMNNINQNQLDFHGIKLKPDILGKIKPDVFNQPSEAELKCLRRFTSGRNILFQGDSGMGPACVVVLATLQQLPKLNDEIYVFVMTHDDDLSDEIRKTFVHFPKHHETDLNVRLFSDANSTDIEQNDKVPHIAVGTPRCIRELIHREKFKLNEKFIAVLMNEVLLSCDHWIAVRDIFNKVNLENQVLIFAKNLFESEQESCMKLAKNNLFMINDTKTEITIRDLQHYYVDVNEREKTDKLKAFLKVFKNETTAIFVKSNDFIDFLKFQLSSHPNYDAKWISIITDSSIQNMNHSLGAKVIFNYNLPQDVELYIDRVNYAGRYGAKYITFVSEKNDAVFNAIKEQPWNAKQITEPNEILFLFDRSLLNHPQLVYKKIKAITKIWKK